MSETVVKVKFTDFEKTETAIKRIMWEEKYKETVTPDGVVWKKGDGFFTADRYFRFDYGENEITVTAWMMLYGLKKSDLTGLAGAVPKQKMLSIIQRIQLSVV